MTKRSAFILCALAVCYTTLSAQPASPLLPLLTEPEGKGTHPDDPTARIAWEWERSLNPRTGQIPDGIKGKEQEFARTLPAKNPFASKEAGAQSLLWRPAGPVNIGGRTRALAIDVADPENMIAGAASGGAWRSIDGGTSWVKTTAPNDIHSVTCVAQDTRAGKQHIWYYGTGELLSTTGRRLDTIHRTMGLGDGIFKSTDNGATWRQLPSTKTGGGGTLSENFQGIWHIAVDPSVTDRDVVFAACYGAVMRSTDGGTSWKPTIGETTRKAFNTELRITSAGTFYAALGSLADMSPAPQQGVWRSTNGTDWTRISPPDFPAQIRRTVITPAPSNPNVLYVLTETPHLQETYGFTSSLHSLWRYTYISGDGSGTGGRWENLTAVFPSDGSGTHYTVYNSLGGYCMAMAVHPLNPDIVVIGGVNLFFTADGFRTLNRFDAPFVENTIIPHPDNHAILFHEIAPDAFLLYTASDGGIARTDRISTAPIAWQLLNNDYRSTQFYSVAIDHATPGNELIIGGLQDNGSAYTAPDLPADTWSFISFGDGCASAIANERQALYVTAQFGALRSLAFDPDLQAYAGTTLQAPLPRTTTDFNFITIFELEPNDTRVMYMPARSRLWRHNDLIALPQQQGELDPNWQELTNVQTGGASITALDASTSPRGRLYCGTSDGRIFRIDNAEQGNPAGIDISGSNFPERGFIASISVDPRDADKVLAAFSNYGVQSLFYTEDGGENWKGVAGNLEEYPDGSGNGPSVRVVKILPINNGTIFFAGTSVGLYSTQSLAEGGTLWEQEGKTTIGSVIIEAIDAREGDGKVVVGSQGNGVFVTNILTAVKEGEEEPATTLLLEQNFPNPAKEETAVRFHLPRPSAVTLTLHNAAGKEIATLLSTTLKAGMHNIEIDLRRLGLPAGAYFYRLQSGGQTATRMMQVFR